MSVILYGGVGLDRALHVRRDPRMQAEMVVHPAKAVIPMWKGLSLITGEPHRAVIAAGEDADRLLGLTGDPVFLGLDGERPVFAAELSHLPAGEDGPDLGLHGSFQPLRGIGHMLPAEEAGLLSYARGLLGWQRRSRFCGDCGAPTISVEGGHMRRCTGPECGAETYPRTDPAVIMLVEDGDRILLHRQRSWSPGMWSCLAGFVEPGETLEEAVAREVMEETGIVAADVRYVASQPWPFPGSLMIAFTARAVGGELCPDRSEIEDANWFSLDDLAEFSDRYRETTGGRYYARPGTAARMLIEGWLKGRHRAGVAAAG